MKRRLENVMLTKMIAGAVGVMALTGSSLAQAAENLRGTWVLVSSVTDKDGQKTEQFGSGAMGMMALDAAGHFMLTIIGADLPRFGSNHRARGNPAANQGQGSKRHALI